MKKYSLVVEVRAIFDKIEHSTFQKNKVLRSPNRAFRLGLLQCRCTIILGDFCVKKGRKALGNNFKMILKAKRWSKFFFTVSILPVTTCT
jgi:hypothetical protein